VPKVPRMAEVAEEGIKKTRNNGKILRGRHAVVPDQNLGNSLSATDKQQGPTDN